MHFQSRKKRSLIFPFNIIGNIIKILFGTLSTNDLKYSDQEIDRLYKNSNERILLQEKSLHINQEMLKEISKDFKSFNKNILEVEKWSSNITSKLDLLRFENQISEALVELQITIDDYKDFIRAYSDGILHAQEGHLSSTLMPPKIVIDSLMNIQKMDKFWTPNFDLSLQNYPLIMKISEVAAYINNTRLVSILRVPIADNIPFIVRKATLCSIVNLIQILLK